MRIARLYRFSGTSYLELPPTTITPPYSGYIAQQTVSDVVTKFFFKITEVISFVFVY